MRITLTEEQQCLKRHLEVAEMKAESEMKYTYELADFLAVLLDEHSWEDVQTTVDELAEAES